MLKCCAISFLSSITASPILILLISRLFFPEPVSVLIAFHISLELPLFSSKAELPLFSSKALQENFLFALLIIVTALFLAAPVIRPIISIIGTPCGFWQLSLRCSCFNTELVIQGAGTARFTHFSRQRQFSSSRDSWESLFNSVAIF